jgi:integrase
MSADFRYMKRPRQTWFFVYNIPPDLRGHSRFLTATGKLMDKITESLGSKDPDKAREIRNQRMAYWDRQFRMMREGPSEDDIREEQVEIYRAALKAEAEGVVSEKLMGLRNFIEEQVESYPRDLRFAISAFAGDEISDYCQRAGITLEAGTEAYQKLGIAFIEAKIAAGMKGVWLPLPDGRRRSGDEQHLPPLSKIEPPTSDPKSIRAPPPKGAAETFAAAAAIYLKTELRDDVKAATVAEYRRKIDTFPHKERPLRAITRGMAAEFLDGLPVAKRTRNLYAALFNAIYKSAIRRDKANANPFDGQRLKGVAQNHYEPFSDGEIARLFADAKFEIAPDKHTTATALPWASLISAYTGLRRDEIASLRADDIKQTDGIWYFDIRDGKTENAERVVPVHHVLIDTGLLKYRNALPNGSRLFPSLKGSPSAPDKIGKRLGYAFEAWRKRLAITRPKVNFHSFRHSVGDRLRKAGVAKDDRGFLLGHADVEIQNKVYGHDGPGLHRLQAIVEKISYGVSR